MFTRDVNCNSTALIKFSCFLPYLTLTSVQLQLHYNMNFVHKYMHRSIHTVSYSHSPLSICLTSSVSCKHDTQIYTHAHICKLSPLKPINMSTLVHCRVQTRAIYRNNDIAVKIIQTVQSFLNEMSIFCHGNTVIQYSNFHLPCGYFFLSC